jgi:DNA-binding transcriptional MerR regulator
MLTPGQIAQTLDVSTATLRRWSARFAPYLSPHTPGKKRSYTVDDLAVLTRVRDLSATGTPLAQIDQALAVTDQSAESSALITLADFAQSLQFARDQVAHLQTQLDQQTARLDALTAWLALPFYKRWFARPPRLDQ